VAINELEEIAKHYARKTDAELERIATQDAAHLRPGVFGIIENEIKRRNLNPELVKGVLAQNKIYTNEEIEKFSKLIRNLPCPLCGNNKDKLNGTISHTFKSFFVITISDTEMTIACPDCLDKKNNAAITSTALLGWWSIPWGIFKTPLYIYRNIVAKEQNRCGFPNKILMSFTLSNMGHLETYKDDKENLLEVIKPKRY
jgi:hypothetical protein